MTCVATDNADGECSLAIGVAPMILSGLSATKAWVATDGAISYDVSPEASPTEPNGCTRFNPLIGVDGREPAFVGVSFGSGCKGS